MADTAEDRRRAELSAHLAAKAQASDRRKILAEYSRLGADPVYAGEFLLTPSLVEILKNRATTRS